MAVLSKCLLQHLAPFELIWLKVASYLHFTDLLKIERSGILEVDVNGHADLVTLAFKYTTELDEKLFTLNVMKRCPRLKRFSNRYYTDSHDEKISSSELGAILAKSCPMLEKLGFVDEVMLSYMANIESKVTNLRKIGIEFRSESTLIQLFKMSPNLEEIEMEMITEKYADMLVKILNQNDVVLPKLRLLSIECCIDAVPLKRLLDCFGDCSQFTLNYMEVHFQTMEIYKVIGSKNFASLNINESDAEILTVVNPKKIKKLRSGFQVPYHKLWLACVNLEQLSMTITEGMKLEDCPLFDCLLDIKNFPKLRHVRVWTRCGGISIADKTSLQAFKDLVQLRSKTKILFLEVLIDINLLGLFSDILKKSKNCEIEMVIVIGAIDQRLVDSYTQMVVQALIRSTNVRKSVYSRGDAVIAKQIVDEAITSNELVNFLRYSGKALRVFTDYI